MTECDANYIVRYNIRGRASSIPQNTISILEWGRKLDDISKAKITHILTDKSCCDELGRIEPWSDTVEIIRNGELVWMGWVTAVEYSFSTVTVEVADALIWSRYRWLEIDYEKTQDSAQHFEDLWNLTVGPDSASPIPVDLIVSATGVVENRRYKESFRRIVWFNLKELLEGSVDVVALGTQLHVGSISAPGTLDLNASDFSGDITLRKDGTLYAGQVGVEGARSVRGVYPSVTPSGDGIYPLVQDLVFDEAVASNASAEAQAKSRQEFSSGIVPRIVRAGDALQLRQGAVEIRKLIPTRIVNIDTSELCVSERQQFRLGSIDVTYTGGIETIGLSLQPIGSLAQVEGITADDDRGNPIDDTAVTY